MLPNNESTTYQHCAHLTLFTSIHWHCNVVRYLSNSCWYCLRFIILFQLHVHIVDIRMLYNISSTSFRHRFPLLIVFTSSTLSPLQFCTTLVYRMNIAYIKVSCLHRLLPWHDSVAGFWYCVFLPYML